MQGAPVGSIANRENYANYGARKVDSTTVNLTNDWKLGGGNLKLLTSYNASDQFAQYELDATPVDFASISYTQDAKQFFTELLYASAPDNPFTYVLGTNFFYEKLDQLVTVPISFLPVPITPGGELKTTSYAAFGQGQYEFAPGTKLLAGLRYSYDKKKIDEFNSFIGQLAQERSWKRLTYEVGLTHKFSRSINGYVKYATGYKSGGFSAGSLMPAFNPETNVNIEAGLKGAYLGGKLQANLAAFRMRYEDLQVNQIRGAFSAVTNAARATVKGVEVEIIARPVEPLRLELTGAYLDAKFDAFQTEDSSRPALGTLDLSGNTLPQAPHLTASVGAYLDISLRSSGTLTLGARYDHKSRVHFTEFNLPVSAQGPSGKADLTLRYRSGDERWTASIFALNVTDARIKSNVLITSSLLGSVALAQLLPGRQLGVSVGYRF